MSKIYGYARLNIQLAASPDIEEIASEVEELLHDAAINGYADEFETFYDAKQRIVGVSIPLEADTMLTLEVGSVLGRCQMEFEDMEDAPESESIWFSIHELDDTTLESPNQ